jgi:chorismate mutase/prephenate dehydratase
VLQRVAAANKGPLPPEGMASIFTEVMSACRALEKRLAIAYLGPEVTFTEMAAEKQFGLSVDRLPCGTIDEVFRRTETGAAHYAVVPVENSSGGAVGRTLDLLPATPLRICGEVVLRVRQHLMAKTPNPLHSFARVYSHPQSFSQCNGWLNQNLPRADRVEVASNAEAARRAAAEADTCALGPEIVAPRYGLQVLAANIEDDARNMTRFLVLGPDRVGPTGRDRTSLVMSAHNRPGAVHELITPFALNGVSMSRIESRPARTGQWEYLFFVDVDGHEDDAIVAKALAEIRDKAPFLKVFGSYPAATEQ